MPEASTREAESLGQEQGDGAERRENKDVRVSNVAKMNQGRGFDVIIVSCGSELQADYWQHRLEKCRGVVLPIDSVVLAVSEDWVGGAGNGLGTLYAVKKAFARASSSLEVDLATKLGRGEISVGLYHTAGKGTRLAPLPAGENNNKPGVKLPATIFIDGQNVPITILEAVIKQTSVYAASRKGRLSVFWGDQIFIPSVEVDYVPTHHVDIMCALGPMVTAEEWRERQMEKYGLVVVAANGLAAQVEKVSHATAEHLLRSMGQIESVGTSLGSFSVSVHMLNCLMEEFRVELDLHEGKLDADPHFWMPLTLEKHAYLHLMNEKGVSEEVSDRHWVRMQEMLRSLDNSMGLFGAVNVGTGMYWWDYGQLKGYLKNQKLLTATTEEASMLRSFFGLSGSRLKNSSLWKATIDTSSCISSCSIGSGSVRNSVLSNVRCDHLDVEDCVLINVTARSIVARPGCIIYNYVAIENPDIALESGEVVVGVFSEDGSQQLFRSHIDIDGGKMWERHLPSPYDAQPTFDEMHKSNKAVDPSLTERAMIEAHRVEWERINSHAVTPTIKPSGQSTASNARFWHGFGFGAALTGFTAYVLSLALVTGRRRTA